MTTINFDLSYTGAAADDHQLDFYDAAAALMGFQRSLAITTHVVLNGQVITQAPSLKGAQIFAVPPQEGSWKVTAIVVAGMFTLGTAPKDTPIGNVIASAYDYVVSRTLGFHVDFDKTLGQQYEELKQSGDNRLPHLSEARLDSAVEKCEVAIREMHRPIVISETAWQGQLSAGSVRGGQRKIGPPLTRQSYDQIHEIIERPETLRSKGRISSYNVNTFKGRVFIGDEERPISFELSDAARNFNSIAAVTRSLDINARSRSNPEGEVLVEAIPLESRTGRLRGLIVLNVVQREQIV